MYSLFAALVRPSRLLSGLALVVVAALQAPTWLLWPMLDKGRRRDVLSMVDRLRTWAAAVAETSDAAQRPTSFGPDRRSASALPADRTAPARSEALSAQRQPVRQDRPDRQRVRR
jgi:hypothetical protein